jgi:hypothetical protein
VTRRKEHGGLNNIILMQRFEGEARRAAGHPLTDVERSLSTALEVSRQQGARMFELRAATALARLWRDQAQKVEARDLLAPAYGWFTVHRGFRHCRFESCQSSPR